MNLKVIRNIQCHNPGMVIEAKDLYYRDLSEK